MRARRLARSANPVTSDLETALTKLEPQLEGLDRLNQQIEPCQPALGAYFKYWLSVYKLHDDFTVLTHAQSRYGASSAAGTEDPVLAESESCTGTGLGE